MVYERMRFIDLPPDGGSMVTHASTGVLAPVYTSGTHGIYDIDGRIYKVWIDIEDTAANGSIWILVSGTNEWIAYTHGSSNADKFLYPRVLCCGSDADAALANANLLGSGLAYTTTEMTCRSLPVYIVGSGLGNSKVINKVRFWYY